MSVLGPVSSQSQELPGTARFARDVIREVQRGRVVLIVAPRRPGTFDGVLSAVRNQRAVADVSRIDAEAVAPAEEVGKAIGLSGADLQGVLSLERGAPEHLRSNSSLFIPWVNQSGKLSREAIQRWRDFLERWSKAAKLDSRLPGFVVEVDNCDLYQACPTSEPSVKVLEFWNCLSILDVRLACRLASDAAGEDEDLRLWKEAVIPELSSSDLGLADTLWNVVDKPPQQLHKALQGYAEAQGWVAATEVRSALYGILRGTVDVQGNHRHRMLWLNGLVECTQEHGVEASIAAHYGIQDREEVDRRRWRGQAALLYPFLDRMRRAIMDALAEEYGPSWRDAMPPPTPQQQSKLDEDPRAFDLGHLEHALREGTVRLESWRPFVSIAATHRNSVAHYRCLDFDQFRQLRTKHRDWAKAIAQ